MRAALSLRRSGTAEAPCRIHNRTAGFLAPGRGCYGRAMKRVLVLAVAACGSSSSPPSAPAPAPAAAEAWPLPAGWKREEIPFPLEFAPSLAHQGVEELRFPPGFLEVGAPARWSYVFEWRLRDAAELDAVALGAELTAYFRGLLVAVDGDKKRIDPSAIVATAELRGDRFALTAHVIDAFRDAAAIDLVGTAKRTQCAGVVVWRFVLAPAASPLRTQLDELAAHAPCKK